MRPYLEKKPLTKIGLVEWLKVEGPEFKPQYHTHTHTKKAAMGLEPGPAYAWRHGDLPHEILLPGPIET
jgi:hypothetical protein